MSNKSLLKRILDACEKYERQEYTAEILISTVFNSFRCLEGLEYNPAYSTDYRKAESYVDELDGILEDTMLGMISELAQKEQINECLVTLKPIIELFLGAQ